MWMATTLLLFRSRGYQEKLKTRELCFLLIQDRDAQTTKGYTADCGLCLAGARASATTASSAAARRHQNRFPLNNIIIIIITASFASFYSHHQSFSIHTPTHTR